MRFGYGVTLAVAASLAMGGMARADEVVSREVPASGQVPPTAVFMNAKPMPLPRTSKLTVDLKTLRAAASTSNPGKPGEVIRRANPGGPVQSAIQLVPYTPVPSKQAGIVTPQAFGEAALPFATSRAELDPKKANVVNMYPYRAAGRLGISIGGRNGWCSAALIDKGLLLTAAHCVAEFGKGIYPNAQWTFIPGFHLGKGAYGAFPARAVFVRKSYLDGSDDCVPDAKGVICRDDVAVIVLRPDSKKRYPGELTGWLGVRLDGWGFTEATEENPFASTLVSQLGYPSGMDNGAQMIRNDGQGIVFGPDIGVGNTILGSPLNEGSSGGPWVNNLGLPPDYGVLATPTYVDANMIVGVTSWGLGDGGVTALQGASPLTSENAGALIKEACAKFSAACTPQKR